MDGDTQERQIMRGNGQGLIEFCARMGERGDLNPSTARAFSSTARKILTVESSDLAAIDLRSLDLDDLFSRFLNIHKADYSEGSIDTYRSRLRQSVTLYLAWLDDEPNWKAAGRIANERPSRPGNSSRPSSSRRPKPARRDVKTSEAEPVTAPDDATRAVPADSGVRLMTYDVPLRHDLIVRVTLPLDLTTEDAERLAAFVRVLAFSGRTGAENPEEGST